MAACLTCELHAESTFRIEGMDCREEVALIRRRFRNLPGLEDFTADLIGQRIHVKYDAAKLSTSAITAAVADAGMSAWLEHERPLVAPAQIERRRRAALIASGITLALALGAEWFSLPQGLGRSLLVVSMAASFPLTLGRAWSALKLRTLDIHVLMAVAAVGALILGEWSEAATVVFLFALSQALEARTLERARTAVRALMDLTPAEALVHTDRGDISVALDQVMPGAVILVKPGDKIPLDGEVIAGSSAVNQAPVTGESLPVDKHTGDEVYAGTINGRGALDVRVSSVWRDTTLARIIHLVERAQAQRAPSQTFVERFARIYTPFVLVLAAVLAVVPPLMLGGAWETWTYRALVLLVVSCPCALVISTPISVVAALAGAARQGVLIKGGVHLERAASVRCVAFDKTGTLTYGRPEVIDVVPLNGLPASRIISLAASVERRSEHPVARAILTYASHLGIDVPDASGVTALMGRGAYGDVDGQPVLVGNHRLFEERQLCTNAVHDRLSELSARGLTPVLVASGGEAVGVIGVADRPRDHVRDVLDALRHQSFRPIVMLSGDTHATAAAIASAIGADEVRAELTPEDKVAAVEDLRRRYGPVAMVGDGVNDAPALASADIGIAMGAIGSDAALETADIALMADELMKIPYMFRLSRATVRNIKINLGLSLLLKGAFVIAAATGVATLWMAVLADTGASVIVVINALRLLRYS